MTAMIEDDIYRTSSQFRFWSFTENFLHQLRLRTNAAATERISPEGKIRCLTAEEEQVLIRYYCEKTLELGDVYNPPLPSAVRVCIYFSGKRTMDGLKSMGLGNSSPVPPTVLPDKFADDILAKNHHVMRLVPGNQDGKLHHLPSTIRQPDPWRRDYDGGDHRSRVPAHAESTVHV